MKLIPLTQGQFAQVSRIIKAGHQYWEGQIGFNWKVIRLGLFLTEEEAARAYDKKAKELFKEFANLNFK